MRNIKNKKEKENKEEGKRKDEKKKNKMRNIKNKKEKRKIRSKKKTEKKKIIYRISRIRRGGKRIIKKETKKQGKAKRFPASCKKGILSRS